MASRAQKLEQIFILDDLYVKKWKASQSALNELKRLERLSLNADGIGVFNVACLNVRSLPKHFEDIKVLKEFQVEVICLQETWVDETESSNSYTFNDFDVSLNSKGRGKGIATFFNLNWTCTGNVSESDLQMTRVSQENIDIINVYRSSSDKLLNERLLTVVNPNKPTIVCGDFNCDVSEDNVEFAKTLDNLGFKQVVERPTHDMGRCIDLVFVNKYFLSAVSVKQIGVGFSDHDCLLIKIKE